MSLGKRQYIPWSIREMVIDRQAAQADITFAEMDTTSIRQRVRFKIETLFGNRPVELHHRPALLNRPIVNGQYDPPANDPNFLVYLPADEHDIETRVRGQHGQHSDLALARKRKRIERKKKKPKRKWPSRKFPKRVKVR